MLKKAPFGLICLLTSAILTGSPTLAEMSASATVQGEAKASELVAQTPNLSTAVLTSQDLPPGFQAMPPSELTKLQRDLSQDDFKVESVFAFIKPQQQNFDLIMGLTSLIETPKDQAEFDSTLTQPEVLRGLLTSGLGETQVLDQQTISGLNNIGNAAGGVSLKVNLDGRTPARLDIVGFRRGTVGAFVFVMYLDGKTPVIPIAEVARKLDSRVQGVVSRAN